MNTLVPKIKRPELLFGFVAPIGADHDRAIRAFRGYFKAQHYDVVEIKVTDLFQLLKRYIVPSTPLETFPPEARYRTYIKYGDQLRREFNDDSILAAMTVVRVMAKRQAQKRAVTELYKNTVYLLHQFKRPEEIALLRAVYGEVFFQVSVYSRRGARVENLARKFAAGHNSTNINAYRAPAEELVQTDELETDAHGQQVGKIFHDADFIVSLDQHAPTPEQQIDRFCELIFSSNKISPTKTEHGMFLAKGAALRSADLSRQVGACLLDQNGQIICLGANEVPKATGGTYWADETFDDRDFARGVDANDIRKREILTELVRALGHDGRMDDVLENPAVKNSQLMDALEYSRVVHAEMNAICDAARAGRPLHGAILYCTTFPCHMCAKQIIAAGISRVIFLEPYPKSLAPELHIDSLQIEGGDRGQYSDFPSAQFLHFFGVTPRRYRELFERRKRKDGEGKFLPYRDNECEPLIDIKSPFYTQPEEVALEAVKKKFVEKIMVDESILQNDAQGSGDA